MPRPGVIVPNINITNKKGPYDMGKSLKKSYKSLDLETYTSIIKDTLIPYMDEYDNEFVTTLTPDTVFTIRKHYYRNMLMGFNIYANNLLLETKSTKRKARRFLKKLAG